MSVESHILQSFGGLLGAIHNALPHQYWFDLFLSCTDDFPPVFLCLQYATGLHIARFSEVLTRTELCVIKDSRMAMGNRSTKVWDVMLQEHVGLGNYELGTQKRDGVRGWYLRLGPHTTGDASFVHPNAQVGCTLPKIEQMPNVTKWRNELKGLHHHLTTPRKEQRKPSSVTPARGTVTTNQITPDRSVTLIHQQEAAKNTYWDSPEARLLFVVPEGTDVRLAIEERIRLLRSVQQKHDGYKFVIRINSEDDWYSLSTHNIFTIRNKSLFVARAYEIALDQLRTGIRWEKDCCKPGKQITLPQKSQVTTSGKVNTWFTGNDE
eukprot:scaffold691_cov50-Cyclotella_meneghiniana.AAC.1